MPAAPEPVDLHTIFMTELLADIVQKASPYGTQDGDFIASYLLPTGPIHRAIAYLNERGISTIPTPQEEDL